MISIPEHRLHQNIVSAKETHEEDVTICHVQPPAVHSGLGVCDHARLQQIFGHLRSHGKADSAMSASKEHPKFVVLDVACAE